MSSRRDAAAGSVFASAPAFSAARPNVPIAACACRATCAGFVTSADPRCTRPIHHAPPPPPPPPPPRFPPPARPPLPPPHPPRRLIPEPRVLRERLERPHRLRPLLRLRKADPLPELRQRRQFRLRRLLQERL